jgi:hypothetical protein
MKPILQTSKSLYGTYVTVRLTTGYVGALRRDAKGTEWTYSLSFGGKRRGTDKGLTKAQALEALLAARKALQKAKATRKRNAATLCRCREPKRHRDCSYCGYGGPCTHICGVCREQGIDGQTIPGTGRVVCRLHKKEGK